MADTKPSKITAEVGSTGLDQHGGRINEEFLPDLKGDRAVKVYKEMRDNDATIGSFLFVASMLLRNVEWSTEPADKTGKAKEVADFVDSCRKDMSHTWEELIDEVLSMLVFGYSYHEIVYKRREGVDQKDPSKRSRFKDGKIGWRKMPIRAQDSLDRWELDESGGVKGMYQRTPTGETVFIPIEKGLLFKPSTYKNNPEGRSILRNAYRSWFFKKRIEEIEGIGIERDLAGLPVIWAPAQIMQESASTEEAATLTNLQDIVRNIRRDDQEGVIMPLVLDDNGNKMYELELLSTGGSRQFNTTEIIGRYDKRIAMTALADFILIGHDKVGSFALSSDKTGMFSVAIGAWLKAIAEVFNRFAIPRLLQVNGISLELLPKFVHGDIEKQDIGQFADAVRKLVESGTIIPDEDLRDKARGLLDLPKLEKTGEPLPTPTLDPENTSQGDDTPDMDANEGDNDE